MTSELSRQEECPRCASKPKHIVSDLTQPDLPAESGNVCFLVNQCSCNQLACVFANAGLLCQVMPAPCVPLGEELPATQHGDEALSIQHRREDERKAEADYRAWVTSEVWHVIMLAHVHLHCMRV